MRICQAARILNPMRWVACARAFRCRAHQTGILTRRRRAHVHQSVPKPSRARKESHPASARNLALSKSPARSARHLPWTIHSSSRSKRKRCVAHVRRLRRMTRVALRFSRVREIGGGTWRYQNIMGVTVKPHLYRLTIVDSHVRRDALSSNLP
jgi:hypothetical protein